MDARRKEIQALQSDIDQLQSRIATECAEIGRRLAELTEPLAAPPELRKYLSNIASLRRSIASFHDDIRRIGDSQHHLEQLRRETADGQKRLRRLQAECESRYEEIGAAAYQAFRSATDSVSFRDIFRPLIDLDDEIRRHEEELRRIEEEERRASLLEKLIRHKGRKVILRGSIHRVERGKLKAYFEVGRRVCDSEFARRIQDRAGKALAFVEERRRQADAIAARNADCAAKITRLEQELRDLGVTSSPQDRIADLEKKIASVEEELRVLTAWAGQWFVDHQPPLPQRPEEIDTKTTLIGGIQKTIAEKQRRIDALKAEIEIDELLEKEKKLKVRRKTLEEELRVKERQMAVLDIEINIGRRRLDELNRVIHQGAPYREAEPLPQPPDLYQEPPSPPAPTPSAPDG